MLISQEIWQNLWQWNSLYSIDFPEDKNPYLSYTIKVRCKNLSVVKLSNKQINLYHRICEFKDKDFTYKQISNKLNELGYEPTRGKVGEFTLQKVWSNYTKIKKSQERKVEVLSRKLTNLDLLWKWDYIMIINWWE